MRFNRNGKPRELHKLDRLHYRRQYVIAVEPVELYGWDCMKINRYYLYILILKSTVLHFVLLVIFTTIDTGKNNGDILVDIVKHGRQENCFQSEEVCRMYFCK